LLIYLYCIGRGIYIRFDVFTAVNTDIVVFCNEDGGIFLPRNLASHLTARYPRKPEDHTVRTFDFTKDFSLRIVKDILV
jgi:hypothetical protein